MAEQPQGETKFGIAQISKPTPKWAKWVFRVFFYITQTVNLALIMFTTIPVEIKLQITEYIAFANLSVHGASKLFGIEDDTTTYYNR